MELEDIKEKKRALEHSIRSHIEGECLDFHADTGLSPQGISVSFSYSDEFTAIGIKRRYFLSSVDVDLGKI